MILIVDSLPCPSKTNWPTPPPHPKKKESTEAKQIGLKFSTKSNPTKDLIFWGAGVYCFICFFFQRVSFAKIFWKPCQVVTQESLGSSEHAFGPQNPEKNKVFEP